MATAQARPVLRHIRELVTAQTSARLLDRDLLERFASRREEGAFETLVRRHGPLVLGVCRRVLGNEHDAEDAFQATFLVLARKAGSVGKAGSVAGWLYQVAYHAALRSRAQTANRRQHEQQAGARCPADPLAEVTGRELLTVLDEQLDQLPERYRTPLVLCYLQGKTCDEAARQLGCPLRTFKRRLEQGRQRLRARLARRGLALSAALLPGGLAHATATAAMPPFLAGATVRTVLSGVGATASGGGGVPASVAALASAVLPAVGALRLRVTAALLMVVTLVALGLGLSSSPSEARHQPAADPAVVGQDGIRADAQPGPAKNKEKKGITASGRVLDEKDKAVAGAPVALVGMVIPTQRGEQWHQEIIAQGKTNAEGRFRLDRPDAAAGRYLSVHVVTAPRGHGMGWQQMGTRTERDKIELKVPPEETVQGRAVDLQGLPAKGVKLRVVKVEHRPPGAKLPIPGFPGSEVEQLREELRRLQMEMGRAGGYPWRGEFEFRSPTPQGAPWWPQTVQADDKGMFRLKGFGKGQAVTLLVDDERFARHEVIVALGDKVVRLALPPPQTISGRIVHGDTGKPVAGAAINVLSFRDNRGKYVLAKTDADGRFRVNPYQGDTFRVEAYAPWDTPYLNVFKAIQWPRGAVQQSVELTMPRGVLVKGKVVEGPSGKPVEEVKVHFVPQREEGGKAPSDLLFGANYQTRTGRDGSFQMVVPARPVRLLLQAPRHGLALQETSDGELISGKPGGIRRYYHAIVPLSMDLKDSTKELTVTLKRAVTLRGTVVGPDGKPVPQAVLFVGKELLPQEDLLSVASPFPGTLNHAVLVRDGKFEIPGCDPDRTYRAFVLDLPGKAVGAAGEIRPGMPVAAPKVIRVTDDPVLWTEGRGLIGQAGLVNSVLEPAKGRVGSAVQLSAKEMAKGPITVKLAPCQSAEIRFTDEKSKPRKHGVWLELLVAPERGKLSAESMILGSPIPTGPSRGKTLVSDDEGRLTIPALIPGATYRLKGVNVTERIDLNVVTFERDFTVEAGKTTTLKITLK